MDRRDILATNGNDGQHYFQPSGDCVGCSMDMMESSGRPACAMESVNGYKMGYPHSERCCARISANPPKQ